MPFVLTGQRDADRCYLGTARLDHFREDGRAAEHAAGACRRPCELGIDCGRLVEAGKVLVEVSTRRRTERSACSVRVPGVGQRTSTRALRPAGRTTTVRGFIPGRAKVAVSVRSSSSTRIGGRSATPWDTSVRQRSTGSPEGPRSGMVSCTGRISHGACGHRLACS